MRPPLGSVVVRALLALSLSSLPAAAATIVVDATGDDLDAGPNGTCTLREAILAANADAPVDGCPGGDPGPIIDVVALGAGTYTLTVPGVDEDASLTGDLDITGPTRVSGAGAAATVIDGGGLDRIFHVDPLETSGGVLLVEDLTLRGGNAASQPSPRGGAIASRSVVVLERCTVTENVAFEGGALYSARDAGVPAVGIADSSFRANLAPGGAGAGWFVDAVVTISDSTFVENAGGGGPGALLFDGSPGALRNTTLSENRYHDNAQVQVRNGIELSVLHVTAVGEQRDTSHIFLATGNASVRFTSSLLVGHCGIDVTGSFASDGGNTESPGAACGLFDDSDQTGIDRLRLGLRPLDDHGGPTPTHALFGGSPAVGAALPQSCPAVDQRGLSRDADACDSGAVQWQSDETLFADGFERGDTSGWIEEAP